MRIIDCRQGSEEWDILRATRPTASQFYRIITPKRGQLSTSHRDYACELVAKQLGLYTEPPPSYWMQWGLDHEAQARQSYATHVQRTVDEVGFVLPDDTDAYGGSPDGLIGDTGVLETKCPKPETLIRYHWDGELPVEYQPQVQGLLLITGCEYCDFFAWHPELQPFLVRVEPDEKYQDAMREVLVEFCIVLEYLKAKVSASGMHIVKWGE